MLIKISFLFFIPHCLSSFKNLCAPCIMDSFLSINPFLFASIQRYVVYCLLWMIFLSILYVLVSSSGFNKCPFSCSTSSHTILSNVSPHSVWFVMPWMMTAVASHRLKTRYILFSFLQVHFLASFHFPSFFG